MLEFIEGSHTYLWNGVQVPSVTQILREWVKLRSDRGYVHTITGNSVDVTTFENAGDFGTAVHMGAKLIMTGGLDWEALDPALVPPLRQFEKWLDDYNVRPIYIEQPMYSPKHMVAGTPDIIGVVQGFTHIDITDIKTGLVNEMVGPQTGGYEIIFRDTEKYRKPIVRHELILPRDGSPYKYNLLDNTRDELFFLSKLFQYQFLKNR